MPPQPPVENASSGVDLPYRISPPVSPVRGGSARSSSSSRRMFGGSSTGGRGSTATEDGQSILSHDERILHSTYNDEDASSIARSIASQRSARSGGYGAYDNRSIRGANNNNNNNNNSSNSNLHTYGPSAGHDSFEDRTQSSPGGNDGQGIGRRIGKAVRRLSGGQFSSANMSRFVDLLDGGNAGGDNHNENTLDLEADDTTYDDNVYGAVINDQERLMEKRRSRRNVCMVCLLVGMMAAFVLVVYGITTHSRRHGGIESIGTALGVSGGDGSNEDMSTEGETIAKEADSTPTPTFAPTEAEDIDQHQEEEIQEELGDEPIDASAKLPPPPADLATVCASSSVLTTEGQVACHNLCRPARCCFIEVNSVLHRSLGCRDSRSDDCQVYEDVCSILDEKFDDGDGSGEETDYAEEVAPGELAPISEMLPSLCSPSSLDDTYEACRNGCTKAECCYLALGHPLSCAGEEYTCALYDQICSALDYYDPKTGRGKDITIEIPSIPADLSETCSQPSLQTLDGLKACHKECFYATCCDIDACAVTNPELCDEYGDICGNLSTLNVAGAASGQALPGGEGGSDFGQAEDGTSVFIGEGSEEDLSKPPPPATGFSQSTLDRVSKLCTQQTLAEPGGITACNIACRPAMCCFYSEDDMTIVKGGHSDENHLGGSMTATCINNKTDEWCSSYDPCQLLLHVDDDDLDDGVISAKELTEAVDQACLFPKEGDTDSCKRICSPGRCCYDDGVPCPTSMDCSVYKSCQSLPSP